MHGPPPPPKRNNRKPTNVLGAGPGHNVARILGNPSTTLDSSVDTIEEYRYSKICLVDDVPDSKIGNGVEIHGEFQFDRLLQIDGKFQGKLLSHGDLIVGKDGCVIGDINTIKRMIVDGGNIVGNISVDELVLRGSATIQGNITCKLLEIIGTDVTICGRANVHPLAPEYVDKDDNIISAAVKKPRKVIKPFPPAIVAPEIEIAVHPEPIIIKEPVVSKKAAPVITPPVQYAKAQPDTSDAEAAAVSAAISKHIQIKNERKEAKRLAAEQKAAKKAAKDKEKDTNTTVLPPVKTIPDVESNKAVLQDFSQELSVNEHGPKVVQDSTVKYTNKSPSKTGENTPVVPSQLVDVSLSELNTTEPTSAISTKTSPAKQIHLPPSAEQREMQAQLDAANGSKKETPTTNTDTVAVAPSEEEKTPLEWGNDSAILDTNTVINQQSDEVSADPDATNADNTTNSQPLVETTSEVPESQPEVTSSAQHSEPQQQRESTPKVKTLKELQSEFTTLAEDVIDGAETGSVAEKGDFMQQAINSET